MEQAKRQVGNESMTPRLTGSKMAQVAAASGGHPPGEERTRNLVFCVSSRRRNFFYNSPKIVIDIHVSC